MAKPGKRKGGIPCHPRKMTDEQLSAFLASAKSKKDKENVSSRC